MSFREPRRTASAAARSHCGCRRLHTGVRLARQGFDCSWHLADRETLQLNLLTGVVDVDTDQIAGRIVIEHHAVGHLSALDTRGLGQIDVKGVGLRMEGNDTQDLPTEFRDFGPEPKPVVFLGFKPNGPIHDADAPFLLQIGPLAKHLGFAVLREPEPGNPPTSPWTGHLNSV